MFLHVSLSEDLKLFNTFFYCKCFVVFLHVSLSKDLKLFNIFFIVNVLYSCQFILNLLSRNFLHG